MPILPITSFITEITNTIIVVLVIAILFEILSLFPSKKKNMVDCETMTEPEPNNSQIKLANLDNLIPPNTRTPTVLRSYGETWYQQKQNRYCHYQDDSDAATATVTVAESEANDVETRYNRQIARSRSRSPYSPNNTSAYYRSRL